MRVTELLSCLHCPIPGQLRVLFQWLLLFYLFQVSDVFVFKFAWVLHFFGTEKQYRFRSKATFWLKVDWLSPKPDRDKETDHHRNRERCQYWLRFILYGGLPVKSFTSSESQQHQNVTILRNLKLPHKHRCIYYTSLGQPGTPRPDLRSPQLCLVNLPTGLFVWIWLIRHLEPCSNVCAVWHLSQLVSASAWPGWLLICTCKMLLLAGDGTSIVFRASCSSRSDPLRATTGKI